MKERPILMSAPMVRACLDGTKTQTRRVMNPQPNRTPLGLGCPYGDAGDRLWVRERHCYLDVEKSAMSQFPLGEQNGGEVGPDVWNLSVEYSDGTQQHRSVDGEKPRQTRERGGMKWRPSIHMPRWASRLVLEVVAVRVERLLAISVDDCFAEGIDLKRCPDCHLCAYGLPEWGHDDLQKSPPEAYWHLWDMLNERRGYGRAKDPWVWVVEFKKVPA